MGGCASTTIEEREAKSRSAGIDKELRVAAREYENTIKILLLGKRTASRPLLWLVYPCVASVRTCGTNP